MRVLVCGGAGYLGSHACVELAARGHDVVVVDNHSNSSPAVLARIARLVGKDVPAHAFDLRDTDALAGLLARERIDAVLHFAAFKAVGESVEQPLRYFDNNIGGTLSLLRAMERAGTPVLVFSSSATVYGGDAPSPVHEDAPVRADNPYARTKLVAEDLIGDMARAGRLHAVVLRYFNPVGAHPSGLIGEDPLGEPNNLMPYVCQVAIGARPFLQVFGDDYATPDGTGVRDYVHVVDLARAHAMALDRLPRAREPLTLNLGLGHGTSVLELVRTFARMSGRDVPYRVVARRAGDIAALWADPSLAAATLGWRAELDLEAMCRDAWRWQERNPGGYREG
jgi:UDP-glucose 4-epimerase